LVGYGTSVVTNRSSGTAVLSFSKEDLYWIARCAAISGSKKFRRVEHPHVKKGPVSTLWAKEATTLVKPDTAGTVVKVGALRVFKGASLTVDGGILEADSFEFGLNTTVNCVTAASCAPAAAGATNYVDAGGWGGGVYEKTGEGKPWSARTRRWRSVMCAWRRARSRSARSAPPTVSGVSPSTAERRRLARARPVPPVRPFPQPDGRRRPQFDVRGYLYGQVL
jgi:hypothetical protein